MHLISPYVYAGIPDIRLERVTDIEQVVKAVENEYGYKIIIEYTKSRKRIEMEPKQMAMKIAREFTRLSLKYIGEYFGGYDHTTVIHNCNSIQNQIDTNDSVRRKYNNIKTSLNIQ